MTPASPFRCVASKWRELPILCLVIAVMFAMAVLALAYLPGQADFGLIATFYIPAFILYLLIWQFAEGREALRFFMVLAVLLRVLLLLAFPQLSDDIYRFIWDGRLINQGINPFAHPPAYYLQAGQSLPGLSSELFTQLNSPDYFTIYPPLAQAVFAGACWLSPHSIAGAALAMKLPLLACELGSLWLLPRLLKRLGLPDKNALLYALNPLVLIEVMGNLHFEGAMIFFFLLGFWLLLSGRWALSAGGMALSVAAKLLPLMFLPFFIRRLGWRRSLGYFFLLGLALLVFFAPLLGGAFFAGFSNSLELYFRKFEFNASIYYLLRWIGLQWKGYNAIAQIGPYLALLVFGGIVLAAWRDKGLTWQSLPPWLLLAICLYLALSPTVHPWYASLPIALSALTRFRFPILWSGLIWLTYINYSYPAYQENFWIVALEYLVVYSFAAWEVFKKKAEVF